MEINGVELPMLIAQAGPLNGHRWFIREPVTIGRDADCDIAIPDRQVSRFHATLSVTANGVVLDDLNSKNGTYCNGAMIDQITMMDGDVFQIALVQTFAFYSSDATLPLGKPVEKQEEEKRLSLDSSSRQVWVLGTEVLPSLSGPQFRLLEVLYDHPDEVVTRQDLILAVWEEEEALGISEQALDALVRRLRDRLAEFDSEQSYIVTVRGHGLRLDNPPE